MLIGFGRPVLHSLRQAVRLLPDNITPQIPAVRTKCKGKLPRDADHILFLNAVPFLWECGVLIGIEFFKMLCKPDVDTILEVVMFVIVRHMVVLDTSAVENLLTIIGMAIIFAIKKFLKTPREEDKEIPESKVREKLDVITKRKVE